MPTPVFFSLAPYNNYEEVCTAGDFFIQASIRGIKLLQFFRDSVSDKRDKFSVVKQPNQKSLKLR